MRSRRSLRPPRARPDGTPRDRRCRSAPHGLRCGTGPDRRRTMTAWRPQSASTNRPPRPGVGAPDVAGTGASRRVEESLKVPLGHHCLGVDPDNEIASRFGDRPVECRRGGPGGVVDPAHPRISRCPRIDPSRRVVPRRPGSDDDVELKVDLLGQHGRQAAIDHLGGVTGGDHHRQRLRWRVEVGGHRADRRAITTIVSSMIMRSSTGDQFTMYCRSWPSL